MKKIKNIIKSIEDYFHSHDHQLIKLITKNEKGEIWKGECSCGDEKRIIFDHESNCVAIKDPK